MRFGIDNSFAARGDCFVAITFFGYRLFVRNENIKMIGIWYNIQEDLTMDITDFLSSKDFMKLGQAIEHKNWSAAGMIAQRMQRDAKEAGVSDLDRQLVMIKQCIASRKKTEALNTLVAMVSKRVKMMEQNINS